MGAFPPGWAEWNDQYRDVARDYWNGPATASALAPRLCASGDIFNRLGRKPWASINFITAHDGFTLRDLVSYNERHNEANGKDNSDGTDNNHSWNCGAEGPTDDATVLDLRDRQSRNLLATLLLSQGTPMLLAGDEFGRTQRGNNNAYCQDNEISWLDWNIGERARQLLEFVRELNALRAKFPILRRRRFLTGHYDEEYQIKDVSWISAAGEEMTQAEWNGGIKCFGMLMDGRSQAHGLRERGTDVTLLMVLNSHWEAVPFKLPNRNGCASWRLLIDTSVTKLARGLEYELGHCYGVEPRSLLLFECAPER